MHIQTPLLTLTTSLALSSASKSVLPTPSMGFNNWARFECALNESLFTATADAMVSKGLLAAGYNRLNIDDCWPLHSRASNGSLQWDPEKFPHGLPWLGQYLKDRGFNFGIYSDAGNSTCGGYPGSLGYEEIDAETFKSWGIDYLKLDGCYVDPSTEARYKQIYGHWHQILSAMSEPLIFSESAPAYFSGEDNLTDWYTVMDWVPKYGELARHSDDIATFDDPDAWSSILTNYGYEVLLARHQAAGYFNDPDFLIVDHGNLTLDEKKSHFALWASFGAPLIISAWIPGLEAEEIEYLTNKNLIEVDQDALGLQATLVSQDGTWDVLTRSLANGDRLLTVLNRGAEEGTLNVSMVRAGYADSQGQEFEVKDLWTGDVSTVTDEIEVTVPSHGTKVFIISASEGCESSLVPTGMVFNTKSLHCLTAGSAGAVGWTNCTGADAQVWQVNDGRTVSSLGNTSECLTAVNDEKGSVAMEACKSSTTQKWGYMVTGNIWSLGAKGCLTEGASGSVTLSACGFERNDQVFEMPSGSAGH
ncbi:alpha-galactosidase [Mollisia scopiformis]|uniref:Alpha-galactosidase n=1 Tax=Mollisia scopiformis TaxID=149040 RepID=A0A194XFZ2_MOLSC|nr:alpha-galactosidase [Mollisia scopiformis]KUJ18692.1 alpha-galactosidase [Mollisia scopiformis]